MTATGQIAAGAVEPVERGHVGIRQAEVEDVRVLLDPLAVGGFRERDDVALHAPAEEHLRRRTADPGRDAADCRM